MVKNLLFDLGHVIVDLDFAKTQRALEDLGWKATRVGPEFKPAFLDDFEVGAIDEARFYHEMRRHLISPDVDEQAICAAWNAMLISIRPETMQILRILSADYRIFIYSNTNTIHAQWIEAYLREHFGSAVWPPEVIEKVYYSHEIGHRKPHPEGFQRIKEDADIAPSETLFIDDLVSNLNTARSLGYHILHKSPSEDLAILLRRNGLF